MKAILSSITKSDIHNYFPNLDFELITKESKYIEGCFHEYYVTDIEDPIKFMRENTNALIPDANFDPPYEWIVSFNDNEEYPFDIGLTLYTDYVD